MLAAGKAGMRSASAAPALSVSISPSPSYDSRVGGGSLTSSLVAATASNGTAPYTYVWTNISGNSFTINTPNASSTTFTTTLIVGQLKSGIYRCTVTDSLSAVAYQEVQVDLEAF